MDTLEKANIFFFVTTIAVVVVTLALLIALYYVVRAVRQMAKTADQVKEVTGDMRESFVYRLLFNSKRHK